MNLKPLFSILLCLIHFTIFCQPTTLLDQLQNTKDTLERMDIFIELSQAYLYSDSEKSVEFAKKGWEIAIFNNVSIAKKHNTITQLGKAYSVHGDYNQAIHIFKEALTDNELTDSIRIEHYSALGMTHLKIEDDTNALLFCQRAIQLSDSLDIPEMSIMARGTLSAIYKKQKKYTEALETIHGSIKISLSDKNKDQSKVLAFAYKDIAYINMQLNQTEDAFSAAQKAIDIANQNQYSFIESEARNNLSKIYLKQSNVDKAIEEALKAKELAQTAKANQLIIEVNFNIIDCYIELNQLSKAEILANQNLDLAKTLKLTAQIINAHQYISKIASKNNNHKKAYTTYLKVVDLLKQSFENKKQKHFKLAEDKINRAKEDALIQSMKEDAKQDKINLRKSKAFSIIMLLLFLFTLLFSFILYRYGVFQKHFPKTSFFKNDYEVRLQYIKQTSSLAILFNIPILLYFYFWGNYTGVIMTGITNCLIIMAHFFARSKKLNFSFITILPLYLLAAITPITTGPLYSVLILNFALFLAIHFIKPEPLFQLVNTFFAIISVFVFFYLIGNYPTSEIQYSADLELIIGAIAFFVANITLFYFSKNINDYKEELIKKNDFLNQISDINPHLIYAKDKNRRYTFTNKVLSEKYQIAKEEFIGKQYEEFENHDENWASKVREDDLNILNNKISVIGREEQIYDLNGIPMWVSNTKKPILNAQNEVEGLLGVTIDITERKLREEHLKESEKRYRELFNLSFDGLFITNEDGEILEINDSAKDLFITNNKEYSKQISDYFPTIYELTDLKKFHQSQIHFGPLSRIDGKKESGEMVPLELSLFKIPYFGEIQIAFAFKNISNQLILQKKEKEFELQKQELENLNKEIVSQEIFANTKNKLLSEIQNDATEIVPLVNGKGKQELNKLIRKIGNNINDEENFFTFKLKFEKSHPEFFNALNHLNPKLTDNDLKLCAYMRLGMTSLDIASLQFIERKSVEMSKYRLKKKLKLQPEDDLNTFIKNI